ncbi:hypothetical protein O6H91_17G076500 [Diphasiastrum complanatum]|uniref:Uncharacterized protein n=1 Tax=Diphasiastrum complanatum TaxID=34168 RepID=A0ACC2B895_DIPCM|nr:hypothetical protein O6H91_17G076500 [Diphasiastrum complanatum]
MKNHEAIGSSPVDAESSPDRASAEISQESSPRSVGDTGSLADDQISVKSEDSNTARVKFLCSYGGNIYPRSHDKQLRYVMGETKIVAVSREITYENLMAKLAKLAGRDIVVKYQLPYEDLDALVSVVSDEDIQNMLEEYEKAEARKAKKNLLRLRLFLFPNKRQDEGIERVGGLRTPEQQFLDAVNGLAVNSRKQYEAPAVTISQVPNYLFGLNTASNSPSNTYTPLQGIKGFGSPDGDFIDLQLPSSVSISACKLAEDLIAQHASNALDVSSSFSQLDLRDHESSARGPLGRVDAGSLSDTPLMGPVAEASFLNGHGRYAMLMPQLFNAKLAHAEKNSTRSYDPKLTSQMQTQQSDAFGASLPPFQQNNYQRVQHEKNENSEFLQRGDVDRGTNSPNYINPIADFYEGSGKTDFLNQFKELRPVDKVQNFGSTFFEGQQEKGDPAHRSQPMYISEESSGLLCQQASSLLEHQHHQQQQQQSHSPATIGHETYWRAHQQQQQNESLFGMCSICSSESAMKAMVPQRPATVVRSAILHLPSKLTAFQAANSGDPSCSRQVCNCQPPPMQFFDQIPPLAALNLQPPITSEVAPCSLPRFNAASSFKFGDQCAQTEGRMAWPLQGGINTSFHHDPVVGSNMHMLYNPYLTLAYAQLLQRGTFQSTDGNFFGFFPNDSSCNQDVLSQGKEAQRIMDRHSHAIYH